MNHRTKIFTLAVFVTINFLLVMGVNIYLGILAVILSALAVKAPWYRLVGGAILAVGFTVLIGGFFALGHIDCRSDCNNQVVHDDYIGRAIVCAGTSAVIFGLTFQKGKGKFSKST